MIRKVEISDAQSIAAIYNYYIRETVITFEETELTIAAIQIRIEKIIKTHFWLVYEENDEILGYAYAGEWRERIAYRRAVETSVYLKNNLNGKGIGTKLYSALLDLLVQSEFTQIVGGITLPNENSAKFHEKFGFKKVGHFKRVGIKFNTWHDVGFWQLSLPIDDPKTLVIND